MRMQSKHIEKWDSSAVMNNNHLTDNTHYWQYTFDLNQKRLNEFYCKKNITHAYDDIREYMFNNKFDNKENKQGSCYFTSERISYLQADRIIRKMFRDLPWLPYCINPNKECLSIRNPESYSHSTYIAHLIKSKSQEERLKMYYSRIKNI